MIVVHEDGKVIQVINDPIEQDTIDILNALNKTYVSFPPITLPPEPVLDENGNQVYTEERTVPRIDPLTGEQMRLPDHPVYYPEPDGTMFEVYERGELLWDVIPAEPLFHPPVIQHTECDIKTDYILNDEITPRPLIESLVSLPSTITIPHNNQYSFTELPDPINVYVDGIETMIEGGQVILSGDMPAEYNVSFSAFPYIDVNFVIIVEEV